MYAVMGATGNVGKVVAERLLAQGQAVTVIGRSAERLAPFVKKGARAAVADAGDPASLARAFAGATAVFAMIPPNYAAEDARAEQNQVAAAIAFAVTKAGIGHVVSLSSWGAHLPEGTGPVAGLHDLEVALDGLAKPHVVHLRAGYFMENFLTTLGLVKSAGILGSPLRSDLGVAMIATRDIGAVAAELLLAHDWTGKKVRDLLGPADVTLDEAARTLGEAIGKKDLKYVAFPYADAKKAMEGMGLSPSVAGSLVELYQAINEGRGFTPAGVRTRENATPTTLATFAREVFAPAFRAG